MNKMSNPIIDDHGTKRWLDKNGKHHRIDGPSLIYTNGSQIWYKNTQLHRIDGPAYIQCNGYHMWWIIDDKRYYDNKSFQEAANLSDEDMSIMILKYGNIK
jgi:hypothetical protein